MVFSSSIPFTQASTVLQHVLRKHTKTHKSPHPIVYHQAIVSTLKEHTFQWNTVFHRTTVNETCPSTHTWNLQIPSKVYVLYQLLSENPAYTHALQMFLSLLPSEEQQKRNDIMIQLGNISCVSDTSMQWLHMHAHEHMEMLTDPHMMEALGAIETDPHLKSILHLWTNYPDLFNYFVPLNVQQQYEAQLHCSRVHTWSFLDKNYSLEIFLPKQSMNKSILHRLCYQITMMSFLGDNRCSSLHLKWFPSNRVKKRGCAVCNANKNKQATLTWNPFQINTGATYRNTCKSITIWRREEAPKTFLHEMMHGYGWDFDAPKHPLHEWVKSHFAVDKDIEVRFYEGYVETWATLLNIYMIVVSVSASNVITQHKKTKRKQRSIKKTQALLHKRKYSTQKMIQQLIQKEQQFVMMQVAKILLHSGFQTWESFMKPHEGSHTSQPCFHQKTSVFSYFIIRSAHLWDVSWFVNTFHSPHFKTNAFTQQQHCFTQWFDHLLTIYRSDAYRACINHYMKLFKTSKTIPMFVQDTMRMTCVEVF